MFNGDLQRRAQRLLRGERRIDDLDRIFLGLRDRSHGRASIREIGDFVAHREQREKGLVTQRTRDMFLSLHLWVRGLLGHRPTLEEIRRVSAANLRTATDEQLAARLGMRRNVAKSVLEQALRKAEQGKPLTDREHLTVNYLGGAFIWSPAFTDKQVFDDMLYLLSKTDLLSDAELKDLQNLKPFLTLYVLTLMHGSAIVLENDIRAELFAGFDNDQGCLEVKVQMILENSSKPIIAPVCLFWTTLLGKEHCSTPLLNEHISWVGPLEIDKEGRLAVMG